MTNKQLTKFAYAMPFLIALGILSACAPINEEECTIGNWQARGIKDGANGREVSYIGTLVEECAQYGVSVDQQAWLTGRSEGLKSYCTASNAYRIGQYGRRLSPVCSNQAALSAPNRAGLAYHAIDEEIDDLKDERRELRGQINALRAVENPTQAHVDLMRRYLRFLDRIEDRIDDLRRDQRRLPSY